ETITRYYDTGSGLIVAWKYDATLHPGLEQDEQLCHWVAKQRSWEVLPEEHQVRDEGNLPYALAIKPNMKLLIGARQRRKHMKWSACRCDIKDIEEGLRGSHRLQQL